MLHFNKRLFQLVGNHNFVRKCAIPSADFVGRAMASGHLEMHIVRHLYSFITQFGCFVVCISDQGHNALNEKLFELVSGTETKYLVHTTLKQMDLMKE